MTADSFSGAACREMRQLLGVYVVGAIDPAERTLVDEHIGRCAQCRDELAGLAGLPAMLGRVPAADIERMNLARAVLPENAEPPAELLSSLLGRVAVVRSRRRWRGITAVAAAAVIAAAGATAINQLIGSAGTQVAGHVASATSHATQAGATVDYAETSFGTAMRVRVSGIAAGTKCEFYVIGRNGMSYAGSWTVSGSYGPTWYAAYSPVSAQALHGFEIMSGSRVLLSIPTH